MSKDDHELGEHEAAIKALQKNQSMLMNRINWIAVMVFVSLADIPITLVM